MDDEFRAKTREDFIGTYWVTGASSPWVEGYDINKTGDLSFDITFHYASSAGPEGDGVAWVKLKQVSDYYRITDLNEQRRKSVKGLTLSPYIFYYLTSHTYR
jgi:hypothetical protein